jgi:hypothetical protein
MGVGIQAVVTMAIGTAVKSGSEVFSVLFAMGAIWWRCPVTGGAFVSREGRAAPPDRGYCFKVAIDIGAVDRERIRGLGKGVD